MIISLGGTPEPLARSIAEHRPAFICFLASHVSVILLGEVKELVEKEGLSFPERRVVLADDVNDLVHCYQKARECTQVPKVQQSSPDQVVVDYTGGTKTMTAALALATVAKGYRFSYVGGEKRNKEGLGVVETGFEVVHLGVSPWQIFAVEEWQHLVLYVGQYQYEAALTLVKQTGNRLPRGEQKLWQALESTLEGLRLWDLFNHREALSKFRQGLGELEDWVRVKDDQVISDFVQQGQVCLAFLKELANETGGFQRLSRLLVVDLVANAERRASQGRYDDAMARLYRALEMVGQIAAEESLGVSTSDFPEEKIPESLREEYCLRYRDRDSGKIKIPLEATFRLLEARGHPAGQQFFARHSDFRKILSARNQSILAHGLQPVMASSYGSLRDLICQAFDLQETVPFPQLRSPY
jgi:CRISPR-associated protein (TIGR02710 family)